MSCSDPRYAFLQVKGFGDLTINVAALRGLPSTVLERCSLLIGPHLSTLVSTLVPPCPVEALPLPDTGVPAVFDLRKCGLAAGLRSALVLRSALSDAAPGATLVMPRTARRETFISGRRVAVALPKAPNVYLAYALLFRDHLRAEHPRQVRKPHGERSGRIALCPVSRVSRKNIPLPLLTDIANTCVRAGLAPELLLLEGESYGHMPGITTRSIPRRFDSLANALAACDGVVSADSLPAHLAEFRGTPVFVALRAPNSYWLPEGAYAGGHWGLFDESRALSSSLSEFLSSSVS